MAGSTFAADQLEGKKQPKTPSLGMDEPVEVVLGTHSQLPPYPANCRPILPTAARLNAQTSTPKCSSPEPRAVLSSGVMG